MTSHQFILAGLENCSKTWTCCDTDCFDLLHKHGFVPSLNTFQLVTNKSIHKMNIHTILTADASYHWRTWWCQWSPCCCRWWSLCKLWPEPRPETAQSALMKSWEPPRSPPTLQTHPRTEALHARAHTHTHTHIHTHTHTHFYSRHFVTSPLLL